METWISVNQQLPPRNTEVLVTRLYWRKTPKCFFSLYVIVAQRVGDVYFDSNRGGILHEIYKGSPVTHWMNIPPFPSL